MVAGCCNGEKCDVWTPRDSRLVVAAVAGVCGIVIGTYYWGTLLAVFEHDPHLRWTKSSTSVANTVCTIAEMVGLLIAGPSADRLHASGLLAFEAVMVCAGMVCVSMSHSVSAMIINFTMVCFIKGLMWPSVGALLSANLAWAKHDLSFLSVAMGSRLGDILASSFLGYCIGTLSYPWRHAVLLLVLVIVIFCIAAMVIVPWRLSEPQDRNELSLVGATLKWQRLIKSVDGWLALTTLLGTYTVWALYGYLAVILHDAYEISPAQAAGFVAWFPAGSFIGLIIASVSSMLGVRTGRAMHVAQGAVGVVALVWLAMFHVPLHLALVLLFLVGFGMVVVSYLPYLLYAANSPRSDRAFRLAMLDGVSLAASVGLTFLFGKMREAGDKNAVHKLYCIAALGQFVATVAMSVLYYRLPDQQRTTASMDSENGPKETTQLQVPRAASTSEAHLAL